LIEATLRLLLLLGLSEAALLGLTEAALLGLAEAARTLTEATGGLSAARTTTPTTTRIARHDTYRLCCENEVAVAARPRRSIVQPTSGVNQNAVDIPRRRREAPSLDASIGLHHGGASATMFGPRA
jgi:hypothetical protein